MVIFHVYHCVAVVLYADHLELTLETTTILLTCNEDKIFLSFCLK